MGAARYRALRDSGMTPIAIAAPRREERDGGARRAAHDPAQARRPGRALGRDEHAPGAGAVRRADRRNRRVHGPPLPHAGAAGGVRLPSAVVERVVSRPRPRKNARARIPRRGETAMSTAVSAPTGTWDVDPSHSRVGFAVKHLGISTVHGQFNEFEGKLEVGEDASSTKATGTVQVASIDTGQPDRDGHLLNSDFFDGEKHPQITFESTSIELGSDNQVKVTGDLTIMGTTKPVAADRHARRHGDRPLRQPARRPRDAWRDQPQGLRHDVQHPARQRRAGDVRHRARSRSTSRRSRRRSAQRSRECSVALARGGVFNWCVEYSRRT